jgi:putative ABC transport system ATP-binding protein
MIYCGVAHAERTERARAALRAVGLEGREEHHPAKLSGGQQQRVAVARALVNNLSMLVADEPTGNLDSRTSVEIMEIFQRLNAERDITILLVTHEADIARYAKRVVLFRDGKIRGDNLVKDRLDASRIVEEMPSVEEEIEEA